MPDWQQLGAAKQLLLSVVAAVDASGWQAPDERQARQVPVLVAAIIATDPAGQARLPRADCRQLHSLLRKLELAELVLPATGAGPGARQVRASLLAPAQADPYWAQARELLAWLPIHNEARLALYLAGFQRRALLVARRRGVYDENQWRARLWMLNDPQAPAAAIRTAMAAVLRVIRRRRPARPGRAAEQLAAGRLATKKLAAEKPAASRKNLDHPTQPC